MPASLIFVRVPALLGAITLLRACFHVKPAWVHAHVHVMNELLACALHRDRRRKRTRATLVRFMRALSVGTGVRGSMPLGACGPGSRARPVDRLPGRPPVKRAGPVDRRLSAGPSPLEAAPWAPLPR
jgi:hypothetical protein